MTLSPLYLWGNTLLCHFKGGLILQISVLVLLRVDTQSILVIVLISKYQDERTRREMLDDIVQSDSEGAIQCGSRLRCTSFWHGHFVMVFTCMANDQGIGLFFHCLLLS